MQQSKKLPTKRRPLRRIANTDDSKQVPLDFKQGLLKNLPASMHSIYER